jgi:hypothetical protein
VDDYTKNDYLILSGGTVDVARNETTNHLRHLTHFLKRTFNTIVVIPNVPHCFGLVNLSCVNKETIVYNRKLQKIVKTLNHVQIQNMNRDRMWYTKHGMRMNLLGKNCKCQNITKKTLDLFLSKSDNLPIPLYWKVPHSVYTTTQKSSNSSVCSLVMNQCPLSKKRPTIRNEDFFLWA